MQGHGDRPSLACHSTVLLVFAEGTLDISRFGFKTLSLGSGLSSASCKRMTCCQVTCCLEFSTSKDLRKKKRILDSLKSMINLAFALDFVK